MRTKTVFLSSLDTGSILIGYQGENEHTKIIINCAPIFTEYPSAVATLMVKPPVGDLYDKEITQTGMNVEWIITAEDTADPGDGKMQLTFTAGTEVIKSAIGSTTINPSLVWNVTGGNA